MSTNRATDLKQEQRTRTWERRRCGMAQPSSVACCGRQRPSAAPKKQSTSSWSARHGNTRAANLPAGGECSTATSPGPGGRGAFASCRLTRASRRPAPTQAGPQRRMPAQAGPRWRAQAEARPRQRVQAGLRRQLAAQARLRGTAAQARLPGMTTQTPDHKLATQVQVLAWPARAGPMPSTAQTAAPAAEGRLQATDPWCRPCPAESSCSIRLGSSGETA
jgi:hypothetical protein